MTLPLIYSLQNSSKSEKQFIINTIKNHSEDNKRVKELINMIKGKGGMDYTISMMQKYRDKANEILLSIPENPSRNSLMALSDYIINRNK